MAETLRFRPVLFGPAERPTEVLYLLEEPDGQVFFRMPDFSWPLDARLDEVTVDDLPAPYHGREHERTFPVLILPPQVAAGEDQHEAFERMLAVLRNIRKQGVPPLRRSA